MSFVFRGLLGLFLAFTTALAFADADAPAPVEPVPAEEPVPEPEVFEEEPAPEPEAEAPAEEEPGNRFYAGGGIGLIENDIGQESGTVTSLNLRAGYYVFPWLAIEGQINAGLNEADLDRAAGTEIDLKRTIGVYAKPHFNFGPLDLFVSVGYADVDATVNGPGISADAGGDGLSYGFGTRIPTSAGAFDFEYLNLLDDGPIAIEGLFFTYSRYFF